MIKGMRLAAACATGVAIVGVALLVAGFAATAVSPPSAPMTSNLASAPRPARPVPVSQLTFHEAAHAAATLPRLYSLLISVDGDLRAEHYFNGASAMRATNIKSASKSVIATLVGIAIDRGHISSVHDPIAPFFPEYLASSPARAAITIEDLVTMRSGLESTSGGNYGRWVQSANWVRHVLERPMVDEPGGQMIYSTGTSHLLSAILTKATRTSTAAFAQRALGEPLGISFAGWTRDPQGIYLGGNEMAMRPRDMMRIGALYLNGGRHEGRQVVSEAWVQTSIEPRTVSRFGNREYGYGWWIRELAGRPVFYAWGYGGQFIFIVPSVRTVAVVTSVSTPGSERREHLRAIYDLIEQHVIPVAATAFPG